MLMLLSTLHSILTRFSISDLRIATASPIQGSTDLWKVNAEFEVTVNDGKDAIAVTFETNATSHGDVNHFAFRGSAISETGYYSWFVISDWEKVNYLTPQDFAVHKANELASKYRDRLHSQQTQQQKKCTSIAAIKKMQQKNSSQQAEKLRSLADKMQRSIDDKLNPAIGQQRPTARRQRIAAGIRQEGYKLQDIQSWLYAIADSRLSGDLPLVLEGIDNKKVLELLYSYTLDDIYNADRMDYYLKNSVWKSDAYDSERKILSKAGIDSYQKTKEAIAALQQLSKRQKPDTTKTKIQELEQNLYGTKISGYFPTPPGLVEQMLDVADIHSGMTVLEPSAGKGNIADALKERGIQPDVIERSQTLREILELKGYNLVSTDFLDFQGQYDRIVQNPPFGKEFGHLHEIDHILHAFECLKPNGRLVSIASAGFNFNQSKKAQDFRTWLESVGAKVKKLPDGSFKDSDRSTGVLTYLIVVNKAKATNPSEAELLKQVRQMQVPLVVASTPEKSISELLHELKQAQAKAKDATFKVMEDLKKMGYGNDSCDDGWESDTPDWKKVAQTQAKQAIELTVAAIENLSVNEMRTLILQLPPSERGKFIKQQWIDWVRQGNVDDHLSTSWERFADSIKGYVPIDGVIESGKSERSSFSILFTTLHKILHQFAKP